MTYPKPETIVKAIEEGREDTIAVTELATALAKDWCSQWGGWPSDNFEQIAQIWAHRPEARRLLKAMKAVAKTSRSSLAATLRAA